MMSGPTEETGDRHDSVSRAGTAREARVDGPSTTDAAKHGRGLKPAPAAPIQTFRFVNPIKSAILTTGSRRGETMKRLNAISIAEAVTESSSPEQAWQRFSGELARIGLTRTALHSGMPLAAENPFGIEQCERAFGAIWNDDFDHQVRSRAGNLRRAEETEFLGFGPALDYLSVSRAPLLVDHRQVIRTRDPTPAARLSGLMIDLFGQYQALILPLRDPVSGKAAILSAWGEEDRGEFTAAVMANMSALHMAAIHFLAMIELRWPLAGDHAGLMPARLSGRERQVLALYARGAQTAEVADRLVLSERTVREYLARARTKLGARSRSQAIARAILDGVID